MPRHFLIICLKVAASLLIVHLITACAATPSMDGGHEGRSLDATETDGGLTRIRLTQLIGWHPLQQGGVVIELSQPRRAYRLALMPSCVFALRTATQIDFASANAQSLAVGDAVLAGQSRCRIVGIYPLDAETSDEIKLRLGVEQQLN